MRIVDQPLHLIDAPWIMACAALLHISISGLVGLVSGEPADEKCEDKKERAQASTYEQGSADLFRHFRLVTPEGHPGSGVEAGQGQNAKPEQGFVAQLIPRPRVSERERGHSAKDGQHDDDDALHSAFLNAGLPESMA